ncbi:MAG: hypothetical protein AB7I12_07335 [Steroidobacteraceae bacterium]
MGAINFSINEKFLCFLHARLGLKWFMETGTFEGSSLVLAARHFDRCISVELSTVYYEKAIAKFHNVANVELHCGHSSEILKDFSEVLQREPGLFWLDAHWCVAENTAGSDSQSPLLSELQAIGRLHPKSVVLVDDARLYLCAPPRPHRYQDWPGLSEIVRILNTLSESHALSIYNDVMAFYPQDIAKEFDEFAYDNGVDWLSIVLSQRQLAADHDSSRQKFRLWKRLMRSVSS